MDLNEILKNTKIMTGPFPEQELSLPENPFQLFEEWYRHAYDSDVKEPNSMVLSTVAQNNTPDSRVVLLKAVDDHSFYFETGKLRSKVAQLDHNSNAALNFYWREQGRQIRVTGTAVIADDISHVSDNLDAAVRDLNAYRFSPLSFEFYQALNAGGYARFLCTMNDRSWTSEWL